MKLIPDVNQAVLKKSIERARERNIILPTFAQMKDPGLAPKAITERLMDVGLWDADPANLFRITWKNEPVRMRPSSVSPASGFPPVHTRSAPPTDAWYHAW